MIPAPGESIALFRAWTAGDYTLATDIIRRDGSRTITAGDEWRVWVSSEDTNYLEDDSEDVAVSWVVEVLSGTATFTAAEVVDPDYGDTTLVPSTSLGTHTVTGPATLVIPSTFTGAQVVNDAGDDVSFLLVLEATSGSAVVQQVKLRVYPSGGVVGGWGDVRPGFNGSQVTPTIRYADAPTLRGTAEASTAEAAWDAAYTAFGAVVASDTAPALRRLRTTGTGGTASQDIARLDPSTLGAGTTLRPTLTVLFGQDWRDAYPIAAGLVEGVDWIVPPNEVPSDPFWYVQRTTDGGTGWVDATVVAADEVGTTMPGHVVVASVAGEYTPVTVGSFPYLSLPIVHAGAVGAIALDTSGRDIFITASHTVATGAGAEWPGWDPGILDGTVTRSNGFGYTLGPVKSYAIVPPYRTWVLTPAVVSKVRQLHRDDGLGVTPPRAFGGASRIRTGRAYGYD